MKKYIETLVIILILNCSVWGQSTTIIPGSILPNMTTAQRTAVVNPPNGMLVFDNSTQSYWFRQNGAWAELPKGGSTQNYWEINGANGNELKNTNSGGFWSANPLALNFGSTDADFPPTAPISGPGTRLMWISARSAFRVGTVENNEWDAHNIGLFSSAIGVNARASGISSNSIGLDTDAEGDRSIAIGSRAQATGDGSAAIGSGTRAIGISSLALGTNSKAQQYGSTAIGTSSQAAGEFSTAIGINNSATGYGSTAIGIRNEASGWYSFSIGYGTHSKAQGGLSVGMYNENTDSPPAYPINADRLFQLGNGSSDSSRSNALTVLRNGNIGTYNELEPKANLHLKYNQTLNWDAHLRLQYDEDDWGNIVYDFDGLKFRTWGEGDDFYFRNKDNTTVARINDTGNMSIAGTLTQNSDKRLKTNLQKIANSSQKLNSLSSYHYTWKPEDRAKGLQTGLIAQEVQKQFPELVYKNEDGYLSVNYIGLIPHLIEAHKELKAENEHLKARLLKIEEKLNFNIETASIK